MSMQRAWWCNVIVYTDCVPCLWYQSPTHQGLKRLGGGQKTKSNNHSCSSSGSSNSLTVDSQVDSLFSAMCAESCVNLRFVALMDKVNVPMSVYVHVGMCAWSYADARVCSSLPCGAMLMPVYAHHCPDTLCMVIWT